MRKKKIIPLIAAASLVALLFSCSTSHSKEGKWVAEAPAG